MTVARKHGLLIGAAASLAALLLLFSGALDGWERTTWDWRVRLFARPGPATDQVVLVLLDQPSLDWASDEMGLAWPWPREIYGALVDFCTRAGVRAVAFDVLFTEPSYYGVYDDELLGEAIRRNERYIGARFLQSAGEDIAEPITEVADTARLLANVSDQPDPDGIFRRAALVSDGVPSLGVGAWLVGADGATLEQLPAPLASDGTALLRYRGGTSAYPVYNAAEVIQSELRLLEGGEPPLDPAVLHDKYVLFGFSAPGLLDLRPTPVSRVSPGVLVHATALDNLLSNGFLRDVGAPLVVLWTALLGLLAALATVGVVGVRRTVPLTAGLLLLPAASGILAYPLGWWMPVLPGTVAVAAAVFGGLVRNYAVEGRQRRFIKSAFQHYLSPAVIEKVLSDPDALKLGGVRRELTILFSDLAGFTSLSEGMEPEALTQLLNDYLTDMTDIILEEGGTLDKYEGDAIIAFWNAPLNQDDHAERACRAAVRCQRKLAERRPDFHARCGRDLRMRMGLHTGDVIVGNMGSKQRFDYTVLGDAANLASRLEGANKHFSTETMISAATLARAGDGFGVRELGALQVVGRREAVTVYELRGTADEDDPAAVRFTEGLARLRAGDTESALALFDGLPDDPVASLFAARMREADAPFTGEWNLTSK